MQQMELMAGNVKLAMKESGAVSSDLWKVPIEQLHVLPGFNVRADGAEHKEHVAGLVDSILANGFYASRPIAGYVAVKDGKQIIAVTDGHCRLEAAKEAIRRGAEIKSLPVVVSPKGTSLEDLTVGLVTNNSGKPLSQYEIGIVCKRLVGFGWDEKEIARRLGMTTQRVSGLLGLVAAPAAVRKLVTSGTVSATQAIDTLKRHGDKAVEKLEAGAEKARLNGKAKATARTIEGKPTFRAVARALLNWSDAWPEKDSAGALADLKKVVKMAREASA